VSEVENKKVALRTEKIITGILKMSCNGMLKYKIVNSSHTKGIYNYMNCKRKLLHCNANIQFNKICLRKKLIPKYAYVKIPTNKNEAARRTQTQAQTLRIKNEIKFLHKKKQLNTQLYYAHIQNANTWQHTWNNIEQSINKKLKQEMEKVYLKQQQKFAP
jgi:hypothetical protein